MIILCHMQDVNTSITLVTSCMYYHRALQDMTGNITNEMARAYNLHVNVPNVYYEKYTLHAP